MSDLAYAITLEAEKSHHTVTLPMGPNVPMPKEGGGGWEEVPLPRRGAVCVWKGIGLMKLAVPVYVDHTEDESPVVPQLETLRHMHRPAERTAEPPILSVSSPGDAIPVLDEVRTWVLNDLEWGEAVGDTQGNRIQQMLTLHLLEYRADERLTSIAAKAAHHRRSRRYRIVRADLAGGLGELAERFHLPGWKFLAEAQSPPRTDPRLTSKDVGKWLVVPQHTHARGLYLVSITDQPTSAG